MAKINTGKPSEKLWELHYDRLGKRAYYTRLVDASEIKGRTGKVAISARSQPSDYILTRGGVTSYCEVKSTLEERRFPFSMLRQTPAAKQILAAGGDYWVYVHSLHHDQWFRVPFTAIEDCKQKGIKSMTWEELQPWRWQP